MAAVCTTMMVALPNVQHLSASLSLMYICISRQSTCMQEQQVYRMGPVASRVRYMRMNSLPAPQLIREADILACAFQGCIRLLTACQA